MSYFAPITTFALLILALTIPASAHPLLANILHRRDSQGLTHGWSDLSGTAKAGVILAPTLAAAFVLFAAFFVVDQKRKHAGHKGSILPCFNRRKPAPGHKKRVSAVPQTSMYKEPSGAADAGVDEQ